MNFQTNSEIKSHSSALFNERINMLFTMLDADGIDLGIKPSIKQILKVKSILEKLWDNLRPIVFYNPAARKKLGLDTDKPGIYTIDSGFAHIQECVNYMISSNNGSYDSLVYTVQQLQYVERLIKQVLQYFSFFIRTESQQMPDFDVASERYKKMADKRTVEEFEKLIGKRSKDIFDSLEIPIEEDELFEDDE